jgi:xanthine dehydrogenase molybdopterin-binding subunit B
MEMAFRTCDNAYYCPEWHITPHFAITNTPTNTSARAPGCLPAIFIMETIMDHVARELGVSGDAFRFANMYQQGQVTPYKMPLTYCNLSSLWTSLQQSSDYASRVAAVASFNSANRWKKQGIAMSPIKFVDGSLNRPLTGLDMASAGAHATLAHLSLFLLPMGLCPFLWAFESSGTFSSSDALRAQRWGKGLTRRSLKWPR